MTFTKESVLGAIEKGFVIASGSQSELDVNIVTNQQRFENYSKKV